MNSKIHIMTVHYRSSRWLDLQLKKINKHCKNFKIYTIYNKMDKMSSYKKYFDYCKLGRVRKKGVSFEGIPRKSWNHWTKLNNLTRKVVNNGDTKDDDILIWIDCDAFPVADVNDFIETKLKEFEFFAINRKELNNSVIPHPSFAGCKVKFWKKHNLSWEGIPHARIGKETHDTGGKIYEMLTKNKIDWYKLNLSHTLTPHQYYFVVYDSLIYHHGAGTRSKRYMHGVSVDMPKLFQDIQKDNFDFYKKVNEQ